MGVLPGAIVTFRAESRYGGSVNIASGAVLSVNTDAFFPLTDEPDDDIDLPRAAPTSANSWVSKIKALLTSQHLCV